MYATFFKDSHPAPNLERVNLQLHLCLPPARMDHHGAECSPLSTCWLAHTRYFSLRSSLKSVANLANILIYLIKTLTIHDYNESTANITLFKTSLKHWVYVLTYSWDFHVPWWQTRYIYCLFLVPPFQEHKQTTSIHWPLKSRVAQPVTQHSWTATLTSRNSKYSQR